MFWGVPGRAQLVDDTRRLVGQGLRELPIHQALALLPVARVDAGRAHRNPDLAGTRMRIGEIHDLEDLRVPEPAEADRLQHSLRSLFRVSRLLCVRQSANLARSAWPGTGLPDEGHGPAILVQSCEGPASSGCIGGGPVASDREEPNRVFGMPRQTGPHAR